MTVNQLKYWELRWKQWYEYQLLQHEKAKLAETKRANRVKEKQAYMSISIDQSDLERKWEELDEKKRAAIVGEGLRKYEADTQLLNVQSMAEQRLKEMEVAAADLYLQYTKAEDESQRKWYEAFANAASKGWGQGAFYGAVELANSENLFTKAKNDMAKVFSSVSGSKFTPSIDKATSPSKISAEVKNTGYGKGVLAVGKKDNLASTVAKGGLSLVSEIANKSSLYGVVQDIKKKTAGVSYKQAAKSNNVMLPIERDYSVAPSGTNNQTNYSGVITSKTTGNSSPSSYSGPKSSGKSGVIVTTNIHKGPGY